MCLLEAPRFMMQLHICIPSDVQTGGSGTRQVVREVEVVDHESKPRDMTPARELDVDEQWQGQMACAVRRMLNEVERGDIPR